MLATELPFVTKVIVPKRRDHEVGRDRLVGPMRAAVGKKAQIVCAPAGYGKTALLVEFVAESDLPVCWYSFSPEDYDPVSFLRYCLQSVRATYAGFASSYPALLRGGANLDWRTQLGFFVSALQSDLDGRLVFVLDDLHWVHGKQELEEVLSLFIQRAPATVHFVLGTRVWPSLSCLPRLAAEDELGTLDTKDLRFSVEETAQLLTRLWNRPVTLKEGEEVNGLTGGWAAATVLTAKSYSAPALTDPSRPSNEGVLFNYLSEEVFDKLPDSLRSFLLRTSVLRQFTATFCDRLLGLSNSQSFINQVRDRGLFLEERTGNSEAYAYHDLFRDYLERRFQAERSEEYILLNANAGALYSDLGDHDAAILHFLRGKQSGRAITLVKQIANAYFDQGRWQKLASWLDTLPQEAVAQEPDLLLLRGQVLLRLGDPTGSLEQLDLLVAGPHGGNRHVVGRALVAKANAYRRLGHLDLAVRAANDGIATLKGMDSFQEHVAEGYKQLGSAFNEQGRYEEAKASFHAALGLLSRANLRLFSLICNDLGVNYMESGDLGQATFYLDQARTGLLKLGSEGPLCDTLINLALVYYHRGEFDLALDEVNEAVRIAQSAYYPRVLATALMNRAIVERALGGYADSLASASHALELARQLLDQRLIAESTYALGNAYRKLGETSKAEVLLKQALRESEDSGQGYIAAIYQIYLGKVYCQLGSYEQALEHLKAAEGQLKGLKSLRRVAEAKLYQAAAYYRLNKLKETVEQLNPVADLVSELGYDGFLLADGDEVLDVLRFGAAKRIGGEAFVRLARRVTQGQVSEEQADGSVVEGGGSSPFPLLRALSFGSPRVLLDTHEVTDPEWRSRKARELFFLLLCNKRVLSNEEIAEALWPDVSTDLSGSTLKTSVYRLRQALFFDCILARESGYLINPEVSIAFDMESFLEGLKLAAVAELGDEAREQHLRKAVSLYGGAFLNGLYSEWCQGLRSELELKYHTALMSLASYRAIKGDFPQAVELLEKVVAADPYNEEAHYQLIESFLKGGQPLAALQQLRGYARISLEELGAQLPPRFVDSHRRVLSLIPRSA